MLAKRVIPCLDVRDGKLTKGIKFAHNVDIGDPVESARKYYEEGADEIVFYDITASAEKRKIFIDVVERVASTIFIPFSVGGGISSVDDMHEVLTAGAEKISINSAAVRNPHLISEGADAFGSQAIVVGMDVLQVPATPEIPSGYEIVINGGRRRMGLDAIAWARRCQELGAGELCVNSIDADGTKDGYELNLTRQIVEAVSIPVMAKVRIGHVAEARILQAIEIDYIDESEVLSPADDVYHIDKNQFDVPFVCGAKNLGEALRRIAEGASMIRTKGEPGTGDVVQAVTHMRAMNAEIRRVQNLREDELYEAAKQLAVPVELVQYVHENGRLPVVNFAAGGVATPADAALMMELGAEGVFVGSGIFKSGDPAKRAAAIVQATANWQDADLLARLSENLGEAMVGINEDEIQTIMAARGE